MPYPGNLTKARYGIRVTRGPDTLPQAGAEPIFTITGGRVIITSIVGEVTTAIQNQANAAKLTSNPTVGTDQDVCAAAEIANKGVGTVFTITGTFADALNMAGVAGPAQAAPVIVPAGTIDFNCVAENTGGVKWTLHYLPLDDSARVVAAAIA